MSVLRQQFAQTLVASVPDATTLEFDLFGPESPLAPPYAENTDHVTEPRQVRQNEAGWVVIDGLSNLAVPTVTFDVEIWQRGAASAQRNLQAPLFPSGAAPAADPSLKRAVATGLVGDSTLLPSILGGGLGGVDTKDVPALHLRADEFVKLRITNGSGGLLADTFLAKYDLGGSPGDTHRLA